MRSLAGSKETVAAVSSAVQGRPVSGTTTRAASLTSSGWPTDNAVDTRRRDDSASSSTQPNSKSRRTEDSSSTSQRAASASQESSGLRH